MSTTNPADGLNVLIRAVLECAVRVPDEYSGMVMAAHLQAGTLAYQRQRLEALRINAG